MNFLIVKNALIKGESGEIRPAELSVKDGKIARIAEKIGENAEFVFDAQGARLCAGLIDCHFHGAGGFDFCDGDLGGLVEIAKLKLREGATSILPATLTLPFDALKNAFECAKKYSLSNRADMPRLLGIHLEGPFVNPRMAGAQNPRHLRPCDAAFAKKLNEIFPIKKLTYAPELDENCEFLREIISMGIVPSCGHSAAAFGEFAKAHSSGLKNITHFANRLSPVASRDIGATGAGLLFDDVFLEIIADKVHLSSDMLSLVFAKKPLSKIALITDSMRASWLGEGSSSLGGLEVVVKGGEARLAKTGALAGSVLKLNEAVKNAAEIANIDISSAAELASKNVADSLNLKGVGRLREGFAADFVLLSEKAEVAAAFVGGKLCYKL
ncbi:MAG: N-acetylglucosamine-6-phosphate deacetylase [Opitutales bacterium]|nr:N-acetylglucosamine-6-phosphate deacetylase [Opitutales bacterium]